MQYFNCLRFGMALFVFLGIQCHTWSQRPEISIPDFTEGDSIPRRYNHDWNLGPTGARGWIYSHQLETTEARQILVTEVDPESPADGILSVGDVIVGVAGKRFQYDPRVEFGKAIGAAEATNGELSLLRWRDDVERNVSIKLEVLGSYSPTAPFDCEKSDRIFERGVRELHRRMQAGPPASNGIVRSLNTLALLSSGNPDFMPTIEEQIRWAAAYSDVQGRSLNCWYYGPINMLLAEYCLATSDRRFIGDLRRITMEIVAGQSAVGSWGHRFARADGRLNGYGMMNAPGLPMTVSLALARQAGIRDPQLDIAIEKSQRLIRFYVGKGSVPYGDHHPWLQTHDDNGKNGIAAILFNVLDDEAAATYFSHMSVAAHGGERELGHTGNYFNMLWAMPGVAIAGPAASGAWMQEYGWYYDLARRWDGTFEHQGPAQPRNDSYHSWDATGAYLLAYAQARRELFITGKKQGVVNPVNDQKADELVECGRGFSHRLSDQMYSDRTDNELIGALASWSPVVRDRAAKALARRDGDFVEQLIGLLKNDDRYAALGACQAISAIGKRAAAAVPALQSTLRSDDLWLQIKAADALAAIGSASASAIPDLLTMLATEPEFADPRGYRQRYLCFALFDRRDGLLSRSLDGVDRERLYEAVQMGLTNEDGRARGALSSVFRNLKYPEIEPLLPAIHHAVAHSAPSGIMFADNIRLAGLEILADHRIKEGMSLCLQLIELNRWGAERRFERCLNTLLEYGGAAVELIPDLRALENQIRRKKRKNKNDKEQLALLADAIDRIQTDDQPRSLRPLPR